MARIGHGVEVRDTSIRMTFTLNGKPHRYTLKLGGQPLAPTPANIKHAHRVAIEIRDKIRHGAFVLGDYFPDEVPVVAAGTTVAAQLNVWLTTARIEESTRAGYASAIKFWKEAASDEVLTPLGSRTLQSLKHSHVLTAVASRPDLSGKTINNYVSVLREALDLAVADKLLPDNPAGAVKRAPHQKGPPDPFSREEAEKIISTLAQAHPGQVTNLVEFWFWTGMRTSEIFGLRWTSVDLASSHVLVSEALVRGLRKDSTKTNVARKVQLNSRAMAALLRQQAHTRVGGDAVFMDPRYGESWSDERAFRRSFWTPTLKRLGIRYRRPYNMRHTYATAMLMAGMNAAYCAKQLGHSVEMFHRTYSKWLDGEQNDREMARLEASLGGNTSLQLPRDNKKGA